MLVRKFIGKRLAQYYAQPSHKVVGSIPQDFKRNTNDQITTQAINFKSLLGDFHWKYLFRNIYDQQQGQWMTPVELFNPYYSNILANFIAKQAKANYGDSTSSDQIALGEIHIIEFGGGRGTNANCILSHLQKHHPDIYSRVQYFLIDSSPTLHQLQYDLVKQGSHGDKVQLIHRDIMDIAEGRAALLEKSKVETYALALEVLDNLPHDKVSRCRRTGNLLQAEVHPLLNDMGMNNTKQEKNEAKQYIEKFVPLTDPLLNKIVNTVPNFAPLTPKNPPKWVPTIACALFEQLYQVRPNSRLLVADFDWLPPPELEHTLNTESMAPHGYEYAEGEPLVTCMKDLDHECYLNAPPLSDILFPTNFTRLANFLQKKLVVQSIDNKYRNKDNTGLNVVRVMKQADFLWNMGEEEVKQTESWITGFSPLIHDFGNCSILTVSRRDQHKQ